MKHLVKTFLKNKKKKQVCDKAKWDGLRGDWKVKIQADKWQTILF